MWTCWRCGTFNTSGNVCYQCGTGSEKGKRREATPLNRAEADDAEKPKRLPASNRPSVAESVPFDPPAPENLFILQPRKYQHWNTLSWADFSSQYPSQIFDITVMLIFILISIGMFVAGVTNESVEERGTLFIACALCLGLSLMSWVFWRINAAKRPKSPPNTPPNVRLYATLIILESVARTNGHSNVFVTYRLTSPTSGKTLTQREMHLNTNPTLWRGTPTPGNQVAIAYWDDEHFRIL